MILVYSIVTWQFCFVRPGIIVLLSVPGWLGHESLTTIRFRPAVFFLFCSVTTNACIAKLFFPFWIHSFDKEELHVLDKYNAILYNSYSPNNLVLSFFWFFAVSGCSVSKTKPSSQSNSEWSDEFDLWFSHSAELWLIFWNSTVTESNCWFTRKVALLLWLTRQETSVRRLCLNQLTKYVGAACVCCLKGTVAGLAFTETRSSCMLPSASGRCWTWYRFHNQLFICFWMSPTFLVSRSEDLSVGVFLWWLNQLFMPWLREVRELKGKCCNSDSHS